MIQLEDGTIFLEKGCLMDMEHRKQYRIKPDMDDVVAVDLVGEKGKTVPGELVDINIGGMGLEISKKNSPELSVGEQVEICLTFKDKDSQVKLSAIVKNQADNEETRRYGFAFIDAEANRIATSAQLFNLFNRRRKQRIEPGKEGTVELVITGGARMWHD